MSYKPGFCCGCGAQTWATDFVGNPIMPLPKVREGYIVFQFSGGRSRLKISICDSCEQAASIENCVAWLASLKGAGVVPEPESYIVESVVGYEPFRKIWDDIGIKVNPIHERALGIGSLQSESGVGHG